MSAEIEARMRRELLISLIEVERRRHQRTQKFVQEKFEGRDDVVEAGIHTGTAALAILDAVEAGLKEGLLPEDVLTALCMLAGSLTGSFAGASGELGCMEMVGRCFGLFGASFMQTSEMLESDDDDDDLAEEEIGETQH